MTTDHGGDKIRTFPGAFRGVGSAGGVDGSGGGPYDGDMEKRVSTLEGKLDAVLPTLATKADMADVKTYMETSRADIHKAMSDTRGWMLATVLTLIFGVIASAIGLFTAVRGLISVQMAPQQQSAPAPVIVVPPYVAPAAAVPEQKPAAPAEAPKPQKK